MKIALKSILIAGLLANATLSVQAQTSAAPDAPPPMTGAANPGMHRRMDPAQVDAMVAKNLAQLKTKLNITAAQEGSWTTFSAAIKPPARPNMGHPDRADMDKLTTPERIDKMRTLRAQHTAERQAHREKRENAVKAFYADLNADQKRIFDAEHSKMMHRWGHRMVRHGGPHEAPRTPVKP